MVIAWPAPSHYLNQCWNIVNLTLRNKLQWNLNRNSNICIQENLFESVDCETASILSRPQCVKLLEEQNLQSSKHPIRSNNLSSMVSFLNIGSCNYCQAAFLFKKWKITLGYALTKTSAKSRYIYANEIVEDYEITFNLTDEFMKWILAKISYIGNSIWSS